MQNLDDLGGSKFYEWRPVAVVIATLTQHRSVLVKMGHDEYTRD